MKLEPGMWDALDEICSRESTAIHEICSRIAKEHKGYNLTAATRAFILAYYRAAATEDVTWPRGMACARSAGQQAGRPQDRPRIAVRSVPGGRRMAGN